MDEKEVLENLCCYNKRNPDYFLDVEDKKPEDCYCDNCFRGNNKLALEILRLRKIIASK